MTIVEAEETLKKAGFEVKSDYIYKNSNTVEEDHVIDTMPVKGLSKKVGTVITLRVSSGKNVVTVENYVGKSYIEIKAALEAKKIYVTIDKKTVEDKTKYKENIIIEQSVEEGTELREGEQIILVVPDIVSNYPNFTDGSWTVDKIKEFCTEYNLKLNIVEEVRTDVAEGTIVSVNKTPEDRIVSSANVTITVAKGPATNLDNIVPE